MNLWIYSERHGAYGRSRGRRRFRRSCRARRDCLPSRAIRAARASGARHRGVGAGDNSAAGRALERALDLAEPDGVLLPFLLYRAPGLLERHGRHGTAHAALVSEILAMLAGTSRLASPPAESGQLREPLSDSETRVLRYLPTNLSAPEIAGQLSLSVNIVRTNIRHVYAKLGAHSRAEAVERARTLGLLAPSSRRLLAALGGGGHRLPFAPARQPG